jgi:hypothetical protein
VTDGIFFIALLVSLAQKIIANFHVLGIFMSKKFGALVGRV